jgi:hypothetical protein
MKKYNKNLRNDAFHPWCAEKFTVAICLAAGREVCEILS